VGEQEPGHKAVKVGLVANHPKPRVAKKRCPL
jgi:hypothetical protein